MNHQGQHNYDTLSEAVNDLIKRGYNTDFIVHDDCESLICNVLPKPLSPDEFVIDEFFRFEGMTDPADNSIVYAISSINHNIKGLVINGYGAENSFRANTLVKNLKTEE